MGVALPEQRNVDNGNQTISDTLTGLIWAKDANLMQSRDPSFDNDHTAGDGRVTWQHALDYIKKLNTENYLEYSDWRLPNSNELVSLLQYVDMSGFTNLPYSWYWSCYAL